MEFWFGKELMFDAGFNWVDTIGHLRKWSEVYKCFDFSIYTALAVEKSSSKIMVAIIVPVTQMVQQTKHLRKWFFH